MRRDVYFPKMRTLISVVLVGLLSSVASAQQRGSGYTTFISGYVMLPDEGQFKATGIEVRLMYGSGMSGAFGIPTGASVLTEDEGRFYFIGTPLEIAAQTAVQSGLSLFLNIRLDGYTEISFSPSN